MNPELVEETSTPEEEGPASLREALRESFAEARKGEPSTEGEVIDLHPADDEPELDPSTEQEAADEPSEDLSQGEPEVIPAPEHWSDEDKASFEELPSAAQSYLLKREKQYEQGIQSKSDELRPLQEAFGPYANMLQMRGIDAPTAVRTWVAAQSALDADPVNGLDMLIQSYGPEVKSALLAHFGQTEEYADSEIEVDPEVAKLRAQLDMQKRQGQQAQMQYKALRDQEAMEQVRLFREAVDDKGAALHPHFEGAQETMRALLSSGQVPDLETAYEQAKWSVPAFRDEYAKQNRTQTEKELADKRAKAAEKAKRASTTVNGSGSKPPPTKLAATLRDDLQAAWSNSVRGER